MKNIEGLVLVKDRWQIRIFGWIAIIIVIAVAAFQAGMYFGKAQYEQSLIAVKYIDGKYGPAFYCIEVIGKEKNSIIEIYARIHIGPPADGYYHDCGMIGTAADWTEARQNFGNILCPENGISIGPYQLEHKQYENHR